MTTREELLKDPASFEAVESCTICGSTESGLDFAEAPFEVRRCKGCGLVYVTPRLRPEALPKVYDEGYWTSEGPKNRGYADYRADEPLYLKTFRKRISILERHHPEPGRVLDVGCAAGYFLSVAREKGWEIQGLELSPDIAAFAQERLGKDSVRIGTIEEAPFDAGSFDAITLWDVVEHVPEPETFLGRVRELLAEDGVLILETQNVRSRFAAKMGPKWHHYKHLEHLYHFDPDTIRLLLDRSGFEILENTPTLGGKYVSVAFIRERAERLSPVMKYLLWPLIPFNAMNFYVNMNDEMVLAARKKRS